VRRRVLTNACCAEPVLIDMAAEMHELIDQYIDVVVEISSQPTLGEITTQNQRGG